MAPKISVQLFLLQYFDCIVVQRGGICVCVCVLLLFLLCVLSLCVSGSVRVLDQTYFNQVRGEPSLSHLKSEASALTAGSCQTQRTDHTGLYRWTDTGHSDQLVPVPTNSSGSTGGALLILSDLLFLLFHFHRELGRPSREKILSPRASTMSFSADSSVTLKKCFSSGSLAMNLISLRKVSGLIPRRL